MQITMEYEKAIGHPDYEKHHQFVEDLRAKIDQAGKRKDKLGRRSHAVVPISECPIAAPLLVNSASGLR